MKLLELRGMTKSFPGVRAVDNVDFALERGEIVGVVGENGAGKSTLMKILAGIYPAGSYQGTIRIDGEDRAFRSVHHAEAQGVVLVPQELHVAPGLSIAENMFVGRLPKRFGLIDEGSLHVKAREWLDFFGIHARPSALAASLTPSEQREVMIAAALSKEASILMLDEPTASLSEGEAQRLFDHLHRLRASGVGIIYISHRLDEIKRLADAVTIMRNGRVAGRFVGAEIEHHSMVRAMIGRASETMDLRRGRGYESDEPALTVSGLSVYDPIETATRRVSNVSFTLYRGEILGLFGLVGAGRSELARAVFGSWGGHTEGTIIVGGRRGLPRTPADAVRMGLAMVTEDRKKSGVFSGQSVGANISAASIGRVARLGYVRSDLEYQRNAGLMDRLRIKATSQRTWIDHLSGGNQQKTIVARWLAAAPHVLILDEPTTGVDVGARFELYRIIQRLADEGRGVLLISSDLEEIAAQCDRVLVMYKGAVRAELPARPDRQALMVAATGGR